MPEQSEHTAKEEKMLLVLPQKGTTENVVFVHSMVYVFSFAPEETECDRQGDDLVFSQEGTGVLALRGFFTTAGAETGYFQLGDGVGIEFEAMREVVSLQSDSFITNGSCAFDAGQPEACRIYIADNTSTSAQEDVLRLEDILGDTSVIAFNGAASTEKVHTVSVSEAVAGPLFQPHPVFSWASVSYDEGHENAVFWWKLGGL